LLAFLVRLQFVEGDIHFGHPILQLFPLGLHLSIETEDLAIDREAVLNPFVDDG
jgi:hypothetical protein